MILEIVKQAVQIKMNCKSECSLISEAEYCCACARALKETGVPGGIEGRAGKGKADALFSGKTWRICGKSHDGQTFEAFGAMPGRGRDYR